MKIERLIFVIGLLAIFSGFVVSYSTYGSPTTFGNETNTTCFIGGDLGELYCMGNVTIGYLTTLGQPVCLENGTNCPAGIVDTFSGTNYTTFLTHISWDNIINGTIWSWVINGTTALSSELNNGSYLNYAWNSTNTSYMLISDWNSTNSSYALFSDLINGTFTDTFNTSEEIWGVCSNDTFLQISDWNTTNSSYALDSDLTNGSYFNIAETDSLAYNGSLLWAYQWNTTNTSYMLISNWNATNTSYALFNDLINGTFTDTDTINTTEELWLAIVNETLVEESELNNGTYVIDSVLNNGTYSAVDTDTFVANYTAFNNKVDWANVGNGTIFTSDTTPQLGGYLDTNGQNIGATDDEVENIYIGTNTRIYFGDGQEFSTYYNGSTLITGG